MESLERQAIATLNKLSSADKLQDVWTETVAFMAQAGFAGVNYGLTRTRVGTSIGDPADVLFLSSHALAAVRAHHASGRYRDMPEYRWVLENDGAMSWGWIEKARAEGRLTAREMAALDAMPKNRARAGYSISFPAADDRSKGAMGLPGPKGTTQAQLDQTWERHGETVMAVASMFHARVMQLPMPVLGHRLTPRQLELLQWIADGKARADLCVLTGLSLSSVEKYLARARLALGVETTAQAVAKLAFLGQLFVTTDTGD